MASGNFQSLRIAEKLLSLPPLLTLSMTLTEITDRIKNKVTQVTGLNAKIKLVLDDNQLSFRPALRNTPGSSRN